MTLKARILFSMLASLAIVLILALWLSLSSFRDYLETRLESQASEIAHTIGVALSQQPTLKKNEIAATLQPILDATAHARIRVADLQGLVLFQHESEPTPVLSEESNFPATLRTFFRQLFPLHPAPGTAEIITQDWKQQGRVVVESQTEPAYRQLEKAALQALGILAAALVIIGLLMTLYLRRMLKPLNTVVEQAEAITHRRYITQHPLPRPQELRTLVSAMNHMVEKLQTIFEREARVNEQLQKLAYEDELTGLGNRAFFEVVIHSLIQHDNTGQPGTFALISLPRLKSLNELYGFEAGNRLLTALTDHLKAIRHKMPASLIFRIKGGDFAFVFPSTSPAQAILQLESLQRKWKDTLERMEIDRTVGALHIGMTEYHNDMTVKDVLNAADEALNTAQRTDSFLYLAPPHRKRNEKHMADTLPLPSQKAASSSEQQEESPEISASSQEDRAQRIQKAIEHKQLQLLVQPCLTRERHLPFHLEVLTHLLDEAGRPIPAHLYLPLLPRLKLDSRFDLLVLEYLAESLSRTAVSVPLAINLSPSLFQSLEALNRLISRLAILPCDRLAFEIPEYFIYLWPEQIQRFATAVQDNGGMLGLDHFGYHLGNKHFLQNYPLSYIKLAKGFATPVRLQDEKTLAYLASLKDMIDDLDMTLIATGIEDMATRDQFEQLGIQYFMGYDIAQPVPLNQWKP